MTLENIRFSAPSERVGAALTGARLLEGRVAVVTGSSRGLGRAFAKALARAGARVIVNGRNEASVSATCREIETEGGACLGVTGNIASWDFTRMLIEASMDTFGRIDILINNAAIVQPHRLWNMTEAEWDAVIGVQLKGSFACAHFAAPIMRRQRGGRIINLLSRAILGGIGQSNNAAAKGGLLAMTWTWAAELASDGVTVNALLPAAQTELARPVIDQALKAARDRGNAKARPEDVGYPPAESIAPLVVYLASDDSSWINGQILDFNGSDLKVCYPPNRTLISRRAVWSLSDFQGSLRALLNDQLAPSPSLPRVGC